MVSQVEPQSSNMSQAIVLQSIATSSNSNNNNNSSPISPNLPISPSCHSTITNFNNTTISSVFSSSSNLSLEEDAIEEFDASGSDSENNDFLPKSSSFSVAETDSDIESDNETQMTVIDELENNQNNNNSSINSSVFQSVISQLKESEKLNSFMKLKDLKYTVVLDIDETLLHSFFPEKVTPAQYQYVRRLAAEEERKQANGEISFEQREFHCVDVGDGTIVVAHLRPHLWDFLSNLFKQFNIAIWSAGGRLYVDNMCRLLFPKGTPQPIFSLCWDDCHLEQTPHTAHYVYTKPMHCLTSKFPDLSLSHLILIDNRKENGFHYPNQIVHCPDFFELPWLNALKSKSEVVVDNYLQAHCFNQIQNTIQTMQLIYNKNFSSVEQKMMNTDNIVATANNFNSLYMDDDFDWDNIVADNTSITNSADDYDLINLMHELQNNSPNNVNINLASA
jgi:hypothetical protein